MRAFIGEFNSSRYSGPSALLCSAHTSRPPTDSQAFTVALNVSIIYGATVGIGKPDSGRSIFFQDAVRG